MAWNGGLHGATKPDSASLDQPSRDLRDRSAAHTAAGGTTVTAGQQLLTTTPTRKQLRISRDTWLQITSTPCKAHNDCEAYVLRPAPRRGGGAATGSKTANSRHNGRRAAGRPGPSRRQRPRLFVSSKNGGEDGLQDDDRLCQGRALYATVMVRS